MIGFVVNQFPRQVDAYFLRELRGLRELGVEYRIYSLLPPPRGWKVHADAAALLPLTIYPPTTLRAWLRALGLALRHPLVFLACLTALIRGHLAAPSALLRTLAIVPQALAFAVDMRDRGIHHVHASWETYPASAAWLIARLAGRSFSFTGHATDIFVHTSMLPEKIASARRIITCTAYNCRYLQDIAPAHRERVVTVHHGVDLARFEPSGVERDPTLVLTVGTLRQCKGMDDLIRAIARLVARGRDVRLEIIGEGEERPALERLIAELDLGQRVRLVGYLPQEEVIPAYQRAAIVALPAHLEDHFGIPNVLIESLAARTPVVATELPSLGELLEDERSGLFVPERDPERLAAVIDRLLADPAWAAGLAAEGRRRVEASFDARHTVRALAETLRAAELKREAA